MEMTISQIDKMMQNELLHYFDTKAHQLNESTPIINKTAPRYKKACNRKALKHNERAAIFLMAEQLKK